MQNSSYHGGHVGVTFSDDIIVANSLDAWFDPAPSVVQAIQSNLPLLLKTSPPQKHQEMILAISFWRGVDVDRLCVGAGSSAIAYTLLPLVVYDNDVVMVVDPMYSEYVNLLRKLNARVVKYNLDPEDDFVFHVNEMVKQLKVTQPKIAIVVNPNSPTGTYIYKNELSHLADRFKGTLFIIDEAYMDFADPGNTAESFQQDNILVLKTLSKCFALSGARVAYCHSNKYIAKKLTDRTPPWAVSFPAQVAVIEAIDNMDYYQKKYRETAIYRDNCVSMLNKLKVINSVANFYLLRVQDASDVCDKLAAKKIFLRNCDSMGEWLGNNFIRVTVKDEETNLKIIKELQQI